MEPHAEPARPRVHRQRRHRQRRRSSCPRRFRHPERQAETPLRRRLVRRRTASTVDALPDDVDHEGAGDALPFGGVLLSGYRFRSDAALARVPVPADRRAPVRSVELVDERLYHLDLTFCPLDDRRAIVRARSAGTPTAARWSRRSCPSRSWLDRRRGARVLRQLGRRRHATSSCRACPPPVGRQLEAWGFDVVGRRRSTSSSRRAAAAAASPSPSTSCSEPACPRIPFAAGDYALAVSAVPPVDSEDRVQRLRVRVGTSPCSSDRRHDACGLRRRLGRLLGVRQHDDDGGRARAQNACPHRGLQDQASTTSCAIGDELKVTWTANFLPDFSPQPHPCLLGHLHRRPGE